MANSGYVQILHELLRSDLVLDAPVAYRWVLITILDHACYAPCTQDDHGILVDLLPGQFMCTERKLATLANVTRNDVQRAIKRFIEVEILSQEVRHTKSIYTILWGIETKTSEPRSEPTLSQERAIKEEYKTFVSVKEQQQATQSVVVFSSLENFSCEGLTRKEKIRITEKNQEQVVIDAIACVSHEDFIPQDTMLKSLRAAIKGQWKPNKSKEFSIEKNRNLAKRLEGIKHVYQFNALNESLEIVKGSRADHVMYQMTEENFIKKVQEQGKINLSEIFNKKGIA